MGRQVKLSCSLLLAALALMAAATAHALPIISEFMASNNTTVTDQDGDYADWLEIYNPDAAAVNLNGWYLATKATNLTKWAFPAVTLQPGAYLLVFCSGKNYLDPAKPLASNFSIGASGGYLALVEPDGATIASSYTFPVQYPDVSYGVTQPTGGGEIAQIGYFARATPGTNNGNRTNILLADQVTISAPSGIFSGSTTVALSGATGTEHIRYVLAEPSAAGDTIPAPTASSALYSGPITVSASNLLRAAVFAADDSQRGLPGTAMYVQIDNSTSNRLDTFSSTLPLVLFDDNGRGLLADDDIYYPGWIGAFSPHNGQTTLVQTPDFFSPDTMKLHGFSSADSPKQSYDTDLNDALGNDVDLPFFGMDSEKSWVSVGPWLYDRTYIHNTFVYALSSGMGHWAPASVFAEMFIHSAGGPLDATSYAGLTSEGDRIKIDAERVNIFSLSTTDITAPNVTGGYILRIDHPETDLFTFTTPQGNVVMVDSPKLDVIVPAQSAYISDYVNQMEAAMVADRASDYATHNYLNFLDRPSWVDYHLLNVFVENVDAFTYSEYFNKDVNGLIKAGPVWDYDRSMGSADGRDANPLQWSPTNYGDYWNTGWWEYLGHDPDFMQAWVDRWQSLRLSLFSNAQLQALITSTAARVGPAAAARDAARWPDDVSRYPGGWAGEVSAMSTWISQRALWIDQQFEAAPLVNLSGSGTVLLPPAGAQVAYTLDGTDPRLSGGGLSPSAKLGSGPVTLPAGQAFLARSYNATAIGLYPGSPWSSPVTTASTTANNVGNLTNLSVRTQVGNGNSLVEGFVVNGPPGSQKQVLIRGVGPTLAQYGVTGALTQPILSVYNGASPPAVIASNSGWSSGSQPDQVAAAAAAVGAFPLPTGSADCALLLTLSPGAYTLHVDGSGTAAGIALGEMYQITQDTSQVVNVSSEALAGTADGTLITGFVIAGGSAQVLIRADGPALTQFGVPGVLAQPQLQVFDAGGNLIASNLGWSTNANAAQIAASAAVVGAFPLPAGSADSALLLSLPAGGYSIQISGVGGTTGEALAESYLVPSN